MAQGFGNEDWREYLPETYKWAQTVAIDSKSELSGDALHILAVKPQPKDDKFSIEAQGFDSSLSQKIQDQAQKIGYRGKGPLAVQLDGNSFYLVPLNSTETTETQLARQWGMDIAKSTKEIKTDEVAIVAPGNLPHAAIVEGLSLGYYDYGLFKGKRTKTKLPTKLRVWGDSFNDQTIEIARAQMKSAALTRTLQDAPANWLDPLKFSEIAKDLANELNLNIKVLGRSALAEQKMGSFLSVAAGSPIEPQLIDIEIPGRDASKTVCLIGKGLTFDAGGNSLKPSAGMAEMKYDMSGGGAVLGAALYLGLTKPSCNVRCIIGAVENMPGGNATRPGDIVTAMNGKTIDVLNTDAEGRLVLADLLHYANTQYKPDLMINIATLTGACLHALGHTGAAVMSNDDDTAKFVLECAKSQGEPIWQLPLWPELKKEVKAEVSDLQNIAKPNVLAGSIIGGTFLQEFVGKTKWAHLDIAGTGWSCKATGFPTAGGSSFGMRTLSEVCRRFAG